MSGRRKAPWLLVAAGITVNVPGDTINLLDSRRQPVGDVPRTRSRGPSRSPDVAGHVAPPRALDPLAGAEAAELPAARRWPPRVGLVVLFLGGVGRVNPVAFGLAEATLVLVGSGWPSRSARLRVRTQDEHRHVGHRPPDRARQPTPPVRRAQRATSPRGPRRRARSRSCSSTSTASSRSTTRSAIRPATRSSSQRRRAAAGLAARRRPAGPARRRRVRGRCCSDAGPRSRPTCPSGSPPASSSRSRWTRSSACIGASIGIALAPADASDARALMACADVAMYRAKVRTCPLACYEPRVRRGRQPRAPGPRAQEGDLGNQLRAALPAPARPAHRARSRRSRRWCAGDTASSG